MKRIFVLFSFVMLIGCNPVVNEPYVWVDNKLIAHALGGIDGETYTNSLEAFEENYKKDHRLFEVDISITNDNKLVARHGWKDDLGQGIENNVSYKEFMNSPYYGKYTPMDFSMILDLLTEYPDIYMILDGKVDSPKDVEVLYAEIGKAVEGIDKNLLERLIPQMFYEADLEVIRNHGFHDLVYVVGREEFTSESLVRFCVENGIRVVSLSRNRTNSDLVKALQENEIYVYMYTLNDIDEMEIYFDMGVHGFFTDFVIELDAKNNPS